MVGLSCPGAQSLPAEAAISAPGAILDCALVGPQGPPGPPAPPRPSTFAAYVVVTRPEGGSTLPGPPTPVWPLSTFPLSFPWPYFVEVGVDHDGQLNSAAVAPRVGWLTATQQQFQPNDSLGVRQRRFIGDSGVQAAWNNYEWFEIVLGDQNASFTITVNTVLPVGVSPVTTAPIAWPPTAANIKAALNAAGIPNTICVDVRAGPQGIAPIPSPFGGGAIPHGVPDFGPPPAPYRTISVFYVALADSTIPDETQPFTHVHILQTHPGCSWTEDPFFDLDTFYPSAGRVFNLLPNQTGSIRPGHIDISADNGSPVFVTAVSNDGGYGGFGTIQYVADLPPCGFWAVVRAPVTGSLSPAYHFDELMPSSVVPGTWMDKQGGYTGRKSWAYEVNRSETVEHDKVVWVQSYFIGGYGFFFMFDAGINQGITVAELDGSPAIKGVRRLDFDQDDGFSVVAGSGYDEATVHFTTKLQVRELDGSPTVQHVDVITFDQADGFVVSQPAAGEARIDFVPPCGCGYCDKLVNVCPIMSSGVVVGIKLMYCRPDGTTYCVTNPNNCDCFVGVQGPQGPPPCVDGDPCNGCTPGTVPAYYDISAAGFVSDGQACGFGACGWAAANGGQHLTRADPDVSHCGWTDSGGHYSIRIPTAGGQALLDVFVTAGACTANYRTAAAVTDCCQTLTFNLIGWNCAANTPPTGAPATLVAVPGGGCCASVGRVADGCCPSIGMPLTLYATFFGALAALGTVTLLWGGSQWSGPATGCGGGNVIITCSGSTLTLSFAGFFDVTLSGSCDPVVDYTGSGTSSTSGCPGVASVSVTETHP